MSSLFDDVPGPREQERVEVLLDRPDLRLERVISTGQATPDGIWYDQEEDEWVAIVRGRAGLRFEDETRVRILEPGDHLLISAHRRHRVEWTDATEPTIWLALHIAAREAGHRHGAP